MTNFPCATIAALDGIIKFGWVSGSLQKRGGYKVRRGHKPLSKNFREVAAADFPVRSYREGTGDAESDDWIEMQEGFDTSEYYFAIPHSGYVWVLIVCNESDLEDDRFE